MTTRRGVVLDVTHELSRFPFQCAQTVRWGDLDMLGHVNHAVFFRYFEHARVRFFDKIGLSSFWNARQGPVLAHAEASFRQQLKYPADIVVGVGVARLKTRSFIIDHAVFQGERLIAHGSVAVVWIDFAGGKAVTLPADLVPILNAHGTVEA